MDGRGRDRGGQSRRKHCHRHLRRLAQLFQCGNCIEVCPTGPCSTAFIVTKRVHGSSTRRSRPIFTARMQCIKYRFASLSRVHRIVARDRYVNGLNGEFLDIKARFAHGFVNHLRQDKNTDDPLSKKAAKLIPATWDAAIKLVADKVQILQGGAGVIASPRLTNEAVFAPQTICRRGSRYRELCHF